MKGTFRFGFLVLGVLAGMMPAANAWAVQNWQPVWHTTRLTYGTYSYRPSVYDGQVAYTAWEGNQTEVFYWDGGITTRVTNTQQNEGTASLWGDLIAWNRYYQDQKQGDIYYYEVSTQRTHQLTNTPELDETHTKVWNGQIVWDTYSDAYEYEVVHWDGSAMHRFQTHNNQRPHPHIGNGRIAWVDRGFQSSGYLVKMWDGTSESFISENGRIEYFAFDGECAWWSRDGIREYWDGQSVAIIDPGFRTMEASVDSGFVIFEGREPQEQYSEIYDWHANQVIRVTDNDVSDEYPSIWVGDGRVHIAYTRRYGHQEPDVMYAWAMIPEPATLAIVLLGGLGIFSRVCRKKLK